ncbi:Heterogeneous nuclear ribonucleoprotein 1 [Thelohanellus kitauei]|uniref:Heterogeneous nuclear ribonucleoprotein 1 n=1 Tax=Thelohanellus kitauei TaxID=669202 RepID=A0A0C2J5M4_THEKT|nr:Heterogeneous nuclear ribonucleoprotein 1 [Thelohanellus kitauei]
MRDRLLIMARKPLIRSTNQHCSEEQLKDYFSQFGPIERIMILRDGFGKPRGSAFIVFQEEYTADNVLVSKPHVLHNFQLEVRYAFPKDFYNLIQTDNQFTNKIFIGGLPRTIRKDEIFQYFKNFYGNSPLFGIDDICIPLDSTGKSKGFAFVKFKHDDLVDRIIFEKSRADICGRICEIKRAEMRDEDIRLETRKNVNVQPQFSTGIFTVLIDKFSLAVPQERVGGMRLISPGVEKLRKLANPIITGPSETCSESEHPFSTQFQNSNGVEVQRPFAISRTPNQSNVLKRTVQMRQDQESKDYSSMYTQETLVYIGRTFVNTISNSIQRDRDIATNPGELMSYVLLETLQQIIHNTKRTI